MVRVIFLEIRSKIFSTHKIPETVKLLSSFLSASEMVNSRFELGKQEATFLTPPPTFATERGKNKGRRKNS